VARSNDACACVRACSRAGRASTEDEVCLYERAPSIRSMTVVSSAVHDEATALSLDTPRRNDNWGVKMEPGHEN
jgi:hypothetical protein